MKLKKAQKGCLGMSCQTSSSYSNLILAIRLRVIDQGMKVEITSPLSPSLRILRIEAVVLINPLNHRGVQQLREMESE